MCRAADRSPVLQGAAVYQHRMLPHLWNRDTNAAIAMLVLFMHWAAGMDKPAAYVRPQQQQPAPPDEPPPPVPPPLPGELAEGPLAWEDEDD